MTKLQPILATCNMVYGALIESSDGRIRKMNYNSVSMSKKRFRMYLLIVLKTHVADV